MFIALAAFVALLITGISRKELNQRHVAIFLLLAVAAFGVTYLLALPLIAFALALCVLDIVLILMVFRDGMPRRRG